MELAKNILERCKKKGITPTQLARLAGVKQPTLHGWITGRSVQNLEELKKLCNVLEGSMHELLFGNKDPFEKGGSIRIQEVFQGRFPITLESLEIKA